MVDSDFIFFSNLDNGISENKKVKSKFEKIFYKEFGQRNKLWIQDLRTLPNSFTSLYKLFAFQNHNTLQQVREIIQSVRKAKSVNPRKDK